MSKQPNKRQQKKKTARAKKNKVKILQSRDVIRKQRKLERLVERVERESKPKGIPYRKSNDPQVEKRQEQQRLEKNIKVLRSLEQQYIQEQEAKQNLNEELEAEGYSNLKEKMAAIHQQAIEIAEKHEKAEEIKQQLQQHKSVGGLGGGAEYRFIPNLPEEENAVEEDENSES